MLIIPAIDLLGGKVVRLSQGAEETAVVYDNDPLHVALEFEKAGAKWIHVVNLDGAFGRPGMNDMAIAQFIQYLSIPIQLGGGIRTLDRIEFWLERGVRRVILGSLAVKEPDLVAKAVRKHGSESIIAGIDIRDGRVSVSGWKESTAIHYMDLARQMETLGIRRVIITDITTDGMLSGPRLNSMSDIARKTHLNVIASGGVGQLKDLKWISKQERYSIEGVIIGKALYEKRFTLKKAILRYQHSEK